jgi:hypothetical protein
VKFMRRRSSTRQSIRHSSVYATDADDET